MDTGTAKILFRPICSNCKKLISDLIDYTAYPVAHNGFVTEKGFVRPTKCPHCDTPFEGIEMPTKLPFDNSLKFNLR